jgi:maltooligosyltrehalose trehalohydrolase
LVNYTQNHDQVANSSRGTRGHLLTSPGRWRAMTALLLLAPGTPMLFQGQEFAASSPFLYFADHHARLADKVRNGRAEFMAQFPNVGTPEMQARLHDPADPFEFERCKLDLAERERHAEWYRLHQDLIRLRRDDAVFRAQRPGGVDGAVLAAEAFLLRYFGAGGNDRLLLVNLGRDLRLEIAPEPLLAPPDGAIWRLLWSSEDPRYGGCGTPHPETEEYWRIPGHAALVLAPQPASEAHA